MLPPHTVDHTTLERVVRARHAAWLRASIAAAFRTLLGKLADRAERPAGAPAKARA